MTARTLARFALLAVPAVAQGQGLDVAIARFRDGDLPAAYRLISRLADAAPDDAATQYWLGEIAGNEAARRGLPGALGPARRSRAGYSRAVALAPDSARYLEGLSNYLSQAPGILGGDRDSALRLAERMRGRDPVRGTFQMAAVLLRMDRRADADSLVARYQAAHPAMPLAQGLAAAYWVRVRRNAAGARRAAEAWRALEPSSAAAAFYRAVALLRTRGEPGEAIAELRIAATTSPPREEPTYAIASAWEWMGQAWVTLGQADSARAALGRALQLAPQRPFARRLLDSLDRAVDRSD